MDFKTETYFHLAILACSKPQTIATIKNNHDLRFLLTKYGSFESAYKELKITPPSEDIAEKLKKAEKYIEKLDLEYKFATINDDNYPSFLKLRAETTPVIYYRGNLDLTKRDSIAVVGTRAPLSENELKDANNVLAQIVKKNYVIVSGLALGCDTLAHRAGLSTGTIAVLGTPINKYYPKENEELQETIARDHLLISQFPIGIDRFLDYRFHQPLNFKKRNQTTVALANKGVLVIKTLDKGGTQNAIHEAQNFGRPLYAMRGNFIPEITWTNNYNWEDHGLIRGAK
jgi:DNA processing protein